MSYSIELTEINKGNIHSHSHMGLGLAMKPTWLGSAQHQLVSIAS
jgi:hypothetical protein